MATNGIDVEMVISDKLETTSDKLYPELSEKMKGTCKENESKNKFYIISQEDRSITPIYEIGRKYETLNRPPDLILNRKKVF